MFWNYIKIEDERFRKIIIIVFLSLILKTLD